LEVGDVKFLKTKDFLDPCKLSKTISGFSFNRLPTVEFQVVDEWNSQSRLQRHKNCKNRFWDYSSHFYAASCAQSQL